MMRRRSLLAAGAAAVLGGPARAAADVVRIGHIVVTSGPLKTVAEPSVAAVEIARDEINAAGGIGGKRIELVRYDTGSDPGQAGVAARKLIEDDHVLALIGPFSSGEAAVATSVSERAHVVMLPNAASVPGLSRGKKYMWRLTQGEDIQFRRLLTALQTRGIPHGTGEIVYISDEAVAANAGNQLYPKFFDEFGIKHGAPIAIQYKTFDMAPQVARIMESKPEVIGLAALPDSAAKVVHELKRQGYTGRVIGSQIFADPNNVELFGADGDGVIFMSGFWGHASPEAEAFVAKYIAENAKRGIHRLGAHHTDAQSYDIVHLLKQAMEKAGVTGDPARVDAEREAIRDALVGIRFTGVLGKDICFTGQDASLPGYAIELRGQQWSLLEKFDAEACTAT